MVIGVLVCSASVPGAAQVPVDSAVGQLVRFHLYSGLGRYRGTLVATDTAMLHLSDFNRGSVSVPWSTVAWMQMRTGEVGHGRGFVRGFVRGGLVGLGVGVAVVAALAVAGENDCVGYCWITPVAAAAILTPPFALSTALVGGVIGSVAFSERWADVALPGRDTAVVVRLLPAGTAGQIGFGVRVAF
jgi:hypothetical protein